MFSNIIVFSRWKSCISCFFRQDIHDNSICHTMHLSQSFMQPKL